MTDHSLVQKIKGVSASAVDDFNRKHGAFSLSNGNLVLYPFKKSIIYLSLVIVICWQIDSTMYDK